MTKMMNSVPRIPNHKHRADGHQWEFWNWEISVTVSELGTWNNAEWAKVWFSEVGSQLWSWRNRKQRTMLQPVPSYVNPRIRGRCPIARRTGIQAISSGC